jgi:hypothetical protein
MDFSLQEKKEKTCRVSARDFLQKTCNKICILRYCNKKYPLFLLKFYYSQTFRTFKPGNPGFSKKHLMITQESH